MFDTAYRKLLAFAGFGSAAAFLAGFTTIPMVPAPVVRTALASITVVALTALYYEVCERELT